MLDPQNRGAASLFPVASVLAEVSDSGCRTSKARTDPSRGTRPADKHGQALIELAFIGMLLALLLLGIFEIVSMFTARSNVVDATRAGARVASLNYADNISIARVLQALDSHGQNTVTNGQCDVTEIDIYEAAARNNQPAPVPVPTQVYLMYPGADPYGGACSSQLNTASGLPPFDQTTRNILAIATQGQAPATVGVRIDYRYHFHTPVLAAAGATFTFSLASVFPLGGDNANNFQNLAVPPAPAPPPIPAAPAGITVSAPGSSTIGPNGVPLSWLCGPPQTSDSTTGTIATTGVLTGTGTISSNPPTYTVSPGGTIATSTTYTGLGTITSNPPTYTVSPGGTIATSTTYTGLGTITSNPPTYTVSPGGTIATSTTYTGLGTITSNTTYGHTGNIATTSSFTGQGTITSHGSSPFISYTYTGNIATTGTLSGTGIVTSNTTYAHSGTIATTGTLSGEGTVTGSTTYTTSGTIATTGTLSGQGTVTGTTTYAYSGTIATTGVLSGQGTVTGATTYSATGTANSSPWSFSGLGKMTITTILPTTYDGTKTGYTITWPAASTTPVAPDGYLLYFVHNGGTPTLVPGITAANPIPASNTTYPGTYLPSALQIYQPPSVSPGDYWYATSIAGGVESATPSPASGAAACTPLVTPPTYIPPPANFQVTLPTCNPANQYPSQLGVRMSWNPVPNASGYVVYAVHAGTPTMLAGMSLLSPWTITQYPPPGNPYDPNLVVGDYWQVYAVLSGVQSPIPATSLTVTQACQPTSIS